MSLDNLLQIISDDNARITELEAELVDLRDKWEKAMPYLEFCLNQMNHGVFAKSPNWGDEREELRKLLEDE